MIRRKTCSGNYRIGVRLNRWKIRKIRFWVTGGLPRVLCRGDITADSIRRREIPSLIPLFQKEGVWPVGFQPLVYPAFIVPLRFKIWACHPLETAWSGAPLVSSSAHIEFFLTSSSQILWETRCQKQPCHVAFAGGGFLPVSGTYWIAGIDLSTLCPDANDPFLDFDRLANYCGRNAVLTRYGETVFTSKCVSLQIVRFFVRPVFPGSPDNNNRGFINTHYISSFW